MLSLVEMQSQLRCDVCTSTVKYCSNKEQLMSLMLMFLLLNMLLLFCVAVLSSASGLEGELFGMGMWAVGLGAVGAALTGIFLANTDLCLTKAANATLQYLEDADLHSTTGGKKTF